MFTKDLFKKKVMVTYRTAPQTFLLLPALTLHTLVTPGRFHENVLDKSFK